VIAQGQLLRVDKEEAALADAPATEKKEAVHKKSLDAPDETRPFGHGKMEVVHVGGVTINRLNYEPGWKWSQDVKPMAKTERCEVEQIKAGDAFVIPAGHDAWTVGNETAILLDVKGSPKH
jgi:hypothetical protein